MTAEDVIRMAEEQKIRFIRLQFTDMFGTLKNVSITRSQLAKVLKYGCSFDGSSIEGFARIEESDMMLLPDPETFVVFPWTEEKNRAARLICDVYKTNGEPFEGDPRYILKKALKEATDRGYCFYVGPECEFFLFLNDGYPFPGALDHVVKLQVRPKQFGQPIADVGRDQAKHGDAQAFAFQYDVGLEHWLSRASVDGIGADPRHVELLRQPRFIDGRAGFDVVVANTQSVILQVIVRASDNVFRRRVNELVVIERGLSLQEVARVEQDDPPRIGFAHPLVVGRCVGQSRLHRMIALEVVA